MTRKKTPYKERKYYVGVDGEGQGRDPHRYTLLAWSNTDGTKCDYVQNEKGLTTEECLDFLVSIPTQAKAFAYAFNYDLTKILTDVDNRSLYHLFRPELRKRPKKSQKFGPFPVTWGDYELNLQGTKFTVKHEPTGRHHVIWDVFKFFQAKFTAALVDWKVATFDELEKMREMKDLRSEFDKLGYDQIRAYCLDECAKMARLAEKLVKAHEDAELPLKVFYGAGSTGGAILKKEGIGEQKRDGPEEMITAIACGFFGGRFENSVIGEVKGPLWSYDISSAYPYQTTFLPCLECGTWKLTRNRQDILNATTALVHYKLGTCKEDLPWGPFPFRTKEGSICYPLESGGGWVWRDEYIEGERIFSHVEFEEAWVYDTKCKHRPFKAIPEYYLVRLRIGKEGQGIVIKLGVNSVYGKLAQSLGDAPPYQCWIWAGIITSGTRAQILQAMALHKNPWNLLMIATDGIASRERLTLPQPMFTATMTEHKKPLGGWEEKEVKKGLFLVRPGIYFPLNPTLDELKTVRARGVGRAVMYAAWQTLIDAWDQKLESIVLADVTRFCGAKSSISRSLDPLFAQTNGQLSNTKDGFVYNRSELFGEWTKRPIELNFNPLPKREKWRSDNTLVVRRFPRDLESVPYDRSLKSQEHKLLSALELELSEQPDGGDYVEYGDGPDA